MVSVSMFPRAIVLAPNDRPIKIDFTLHFTLGKKIATYVPSYLVPQCGVDSFALSEQGNIDRG